jgi:hypothetical protein
MDRGMTECDVRDNGNSKILKYLSQYYIVHHKSHIDWPGIVKLHLCSKRLESNQLSDGIALDLSGMDVVGIINIF